MKIIKLNCAACGAPISLPENLEQLSCSNCGTHLMVEHGEGYYALKAVEQLSEAIEQSGNKTQDAIREGAQVTQIELKRLQLSQTLSSATSALNATQSEQRTLTRTQMTPAAQHQLQELKVQEFTQREEIRQIQKQIDLLEGGPLEGNYQALTNQIHLLEKSIATLQSCPQTSKNRSIMQKLVRELQKYQSHIKTLHANQLRKKTKSFSIRPPFGTDLNELLGQLRQIQSDLGSISNQPPSPYKPTLLNELTQLQSRLFQHYHQEVYRQCWGNANPSTDPGENPERLGHHLDASQATTKWLSAVPNPSKAIRKEIKGLQRSEKKLAKHFSLAQERLRFTEAKKALYAGLAAFAISAPFSNDLDKVREQVNVYQKDLQGLKEQPGSPEIRQVQGELNQRYQGLYQHWASLERQELEIKLTSNEIQPPFKNDFAEARADYDLIMTDIEMLKEHSSIPGIQQRIQRLTAKQRLLYAHLQSLAAQSTESGEKQSE